MINMKKTEEMPEAYEDMDEPAYPYGLCITLDAEQLDKLGMEVVEVDLRDAYAFGGGLHCCTADVYREGGLEDYFPKG